VHLMSPENQALTGCINAGLERPIEGGPPQLAPISPILEWDRLLELSAWHGVEGLVHAALARTSNGSAGGIAPAESLEMLGAAAAAASIRTSFLLIQRDRVCAALAADGIPVMLLKGAALHEMVYTSVASRSMGDLDLLVPESAVGAAIDTVSAIGFQSDAAQMNRWPVTHRHAPRLISNDAAAVVELHRHILNDPGIASIDPMWQRARPGRGGPWLTPSPTDMAVHLAVHFTEDRAFHSRFALRQLADLAATIRMAGVDLNWDLLAGEARRLGRSISVFLALHTVHEVMGTPLPEDLLQSLVPPGCTRAIRCRFIDRWVLATGPRPPLEVVAARVAGGGRGDASFRRIIRRLAPLLSHPAAAAEDLRLNCLVKRETPRLFG
jgi:hypothetical protein